MPSAGQTRVGATSATGTMLQSDDSVLDVAQALTTALAHLAQMVANTGGTDAVNLESIMAAVQRAVEDISNAASDNKTSQEATQAAVEAVRALTEQLVTGDGTAYLPLLTAVRDLLATIDASNAAIQTAVELIDDAVGTHGADVSTAIVATGSKAETGVPAAVADGEDVRDNVDAYGRARSAEYDPATGTAQVTDAAPAQMQVLIEDGWAALTAAGDVTPARDVRDYENHTVAYDITIGSLTSMDLIIWGSIDGTLWFKLWEDNILSSEDLEDAVTFSGVQVTYIRCELEAENGDTDGSVVFQLTSGN